MVNEIAVLITKTYYYNKFLIYDQVFMIFLLITETHFGSNFFFYPRSKLYILLKILNSIAGLITETHMRVIYKI